MKKRIIGFISILLALSIMTFSGCTVTIEPNDSTTNVNTIKEEVIEIECKKDTVYHLDVCKFRVVVIDSCEYIYGVLKSSDLRRGYRFLAHKGNCKFCDERRKHSNKQHSANISTIKDNFFDYE